jgi:hypothetical protein
LVRFFAVATAVISLSDPLQKLISQMPVEFIAQTSLPLAVFCITIMLALFMLSLGELLPKTLALHLCRTHCLGRGLSHRPLRYHRIPRRQGSNRHL